jgi:putative restriction endonuclease
MKNKLWSKDELIIAFNLYCKIPFSKLVSTNPQIIELSKILNRTPSAVSMKLCNFARLDPELSKRGIKGLQAGSKLDEIVWNEFHEDWDKLAYESESLLAARKGITIEKEINLSEKDIPVGLNREQIVKIRVNQYFFRQTVLSTYNNKCCITSIEIPSLLNASHIVPWSKDEKNRLNPQNGLCLNVFHDRAFDKGLMTITPEFTINISNKLKDFGNEVIQKWLLSYDNKKITLPDRFIPDPNFLTYHNNHIFLK